MDFWDDLREVERRADFERGSAPFAQWSARAQERLRRDVFGLPDSVECEAVATEERRYSAWRAGYNKGWAEARVAAHQRLKRAGLFCFLFGAAAAALVAYCLNS